MDEVRLKEILIEAGVRGLNVDYTSYVREESALRTALKIEQTKLNNEVGCEIKVGSSKDLGTLLYEKRGNPAVRTGNGNYSVSIEALQTCKDPLVPLIMGIKKLEANLKYFKIASKHLHQDGKRYWIPYQFVVDSCITGRIYAKEPSVMSFPLSLRICIVPEEGHIFVHADYEREEMCILAHYAGDKEFLDDVKNGADVFQELANMFDPDKRDVAKVVVYAHFYGASSEGLTRKLHLEEGVVNGVLDALKVRYPLLAKAPDRIIEFAKEKGYSETLLEKKRYIINKDNPDQDEEIRRACNFLPQGTAAEILRRSIIRLANCGYNWKISTHDSYLIDVPEIAMSTEHNIRALLTQDLPDALFVKIGTGKTWLEASGAKEVESEVS